MKNAVRILTLVLCLLILVPVLFCTVSAAESNLYISYDDASTYLFQLANFHLQKGDEVGAQIYSLLNGNSDSYINRMAPLGAAKPESNPEIDLLYHQGKAVAHLAWFYYSNPDTHEIAIEEGLTEELNVTVQSVYEAQKAIIDGMKYDTEQDADVQKQIFDFFFYNTNPDESATTIDDCYTAMLSAIYKAKILSVKEQGISEALSKKIDSEIIPDIEALTYNGAISDDDFETVYDANTNYEEVLQGAEIFISQYQFWETTQAQVALVLQQLFPDESVDTTARLSTFREKIALATPIYGTNNTATGKIECVSNCNTILKETVVSLLDQYKELPQLQRPECSITYRSAYLELFKQQTINPAFTAAGFSGIPDIASTLNDDFHAAVLRADAKDSLVTDSQTLGLPADSYTAEQLEMRQQIVSDYTKDDSQTTEANDAIFDTCDLESLSAQLERARKRLRLFDSYVDTLNQIKDQVGTTGTSSYNADDLTELTGAAATIRTETDEVLKSSNDPQEDLSSGENRLNQLV
ncbi:MAG: hypothetical protein IJW44_01015, partial [Clostridia bacterium]|nr:hypothetical protein [Clostridia bacterium]